MTSRASRQLDDLTTQDFRRIDERIDALSIDPRPNGVTKLWDKVHRIRVGAWRIIYIIDDAKRVVLIDGVLRREKDTYH